MKPNAMPVLSGSPRRQSRRRYETAPAKPTQEVWKDGRKMIAVTSFFTPAQYQVLVEQTRKAECCNLNQMLVARACCDMEAWGSVGEFREASSYGFYEFVVKGRAPKLSI